jgi:hypothetical protein
MPVVELKVEQQFKLRQIEDALRNPNTKKEDIITIFLALQQQCFVLGNNVSNLIKQWPIQPPTVQTTTNEEVLSLGTSLETKG